MRLLALGMSIAACLGIARLSMADSVVRPVPARATMLSHHEDFRVGLGLDASERERLLNGGVVARAVEFDRDGGRYVGAVSYVLIDADPEHALSELARVEQLPSVLPRTRRARLLDNGDTGSRIELTQGNEWFDATYTILMVQDPDQVSFWLDENSPSDIDDVFGYFRVEAFDGRRSLATVAVAVDVGSVMFRGFIEERVVEAIVATPDRIRRFVEPRALLATR